MPCSRASAVWLRGFGRCADVAARAVQPLIESLSEFVAQLAQIIIANKAHNKAPPQNLPLCVAGVQKAAGSLEWVLGQASLTHSAQERWCRWPSSWRRTSTRTFRRFR